MSTVAFVSTFTPAMPLTPRPPIASDPDDDASAPALNAVVVVNSSEAEVSAPQLCEVGSFGTELKETS